MKGEKIILSSQQTQKTTPFYKIQHLFIIKTLNKLGTKRMYHNIMAIQDKPIANILFNGERSNAFLLRSGARLRCPLSPFTLITIFTKQGNKQIKPPQK